MGPNIISLSQDLRSPRSEPRNGFLRRGMATLSTNVPDAAAPNFIVKALVPICGAVQSARGVILCIIPCRGARTVWVNSWLMVLEEVIWTDRPHLQVLAPTLPFFYHSSDDDMLMQVARYLGATKKAMLALKDYYDFELPHITAQRPNVAFPHLSEYHSLDDATIHRFKYLSHPDKDRRIFRGAVNNDKISIKFVRRYLKEAHLKCSSLGFAPALRGFERISGGWYIVVMNFIDDEYCIMIW